MKTTLSILVSLAFIGLGSSAMAADSYFHRVPAQVKCPAAGCVPAAARIHPGAAGGEGTTPAAPAQPSKLVLGTTSLNFGSINFGTSAPAQSVRVTNSGDADAAITGLSVVSGSVDFGQSNDCGKVLAVGASCDVNVAFAPNARGIRFGQLGILTSGQSLSVSLVGTGLRAAGAFIPVTSTDFGSANVNEATDIRQFRFTNTGDAPATNTYISVEGGGLSFSSGRGNTCGTLSLKATIAPGASCTVNVTYTRSTAGSLNGFVVLNSSAEGAPMRIPVTGEAVQPAVSLSNSNGIGVTTDIFTTQLRGVSLSKTYTLKNHSAAEVTITQIAISGADTFSQVNNCGASLAAHSSCSIDVTFLSNLGTNTTTTASLAVVTGARTFNVAVEGSETDRVISWAGTSFIAPLGGTSAPYTITVTANPVAAVPVRGLTFSNPAEFTYSSTCGTAIPAGASCAFTVLFTPIEGGSHTTNVTVEVGNSPTGSSFQGTVK